MIDTKLILDFWFVQCTPNMWFKKSDSIDQLLRTKFKKNKPVTADTKCPKKTLRG